MCFERWAVGNKALRFIFESPAEVLGGATAFHQAIERVRRKKLRRDHHAEVFRTLARDIAMTRASCVLGDPDLHARFNQVREAVIGAQRQVNAARLETGTMRNKVRGDQFEVKHSAGAMVDIEFAVQFR